MDANHLIDTGLYPKNVFDILFKHEVARSQRHSSPLTLLKLQPFLEEAPHEIRESAVLTITSMLNVKLRVTDVPTFINRGLFFWIVLTDTDNIGGKVVCERILDIVANMQSYETIDGIPFNIYANIGMTSHSTKSFTGAQLYTEADMALTAARKKGMQTYVDFHNIEAALFNPN